MWEKILEDLNVIISAHSDDEKYVIGLCNCHDCVQKRLEEALEGPKARVKEAFPKDLLIYGMERRSLIDLLSDSLPYGTPQWKKNILDIVILKSSAEDNVVRSKKVPKKKQAHCSCCGTIVNTSICKALRMRGKEHFICKKCLPSFSRCDDCGAYEVKGNLVYGDYYNESGDGVVHKVTCQDCFQTNYIQCGLCSIYMKKVVNTHLFLGGNGERNVCPKCMEKNIVKCSDCGNYMHVGGGWREPHRQPPYVCDDCIQYAEPINNYNFKPNPLFTTNEVLEPAPSKIKSALFYGVELEIENISKQLSNRNMAIKARSFMPPKHMYAKNDSSLSTGFELVTQPFTWKWLLANRERWKKVYDAVKKNGFGTGPNAGMHVHMSKDAFTSFHLYKFVQFMYSKQCRKFVQGISERDGRFDYCKFDAVDVNNTKKIAKLKNNMAADKHHSAVNLSNWSTVEVRIFQTPDTVEGFYKNMEFCHALYHFALDNPPNMMVPKEFLQFIGNKTRANQYRNLITFIMESNDFSKPFKNALK